MNPHSPPPPFAAPRTRRFSRFRAKTVAVLASSLLLVGGSVAAVGATAHAATTTAKHTVTYDQYSFMVDGKRVYLWSGEFHYNRLPSPELWRDVLTRIKAAGFNAVSLYFDWAYHSPRQGVYDFTGVRDVERLLKLTDELGLYVIARPGPYINAEVDSGGFPGWLDTQAAHARTNAADYLAAADEWLSQIDPIIARHQLTNGTGTVITYQVENEFYKTGADDRSYMKHLVQKVRDTDKITLPLVGNHNNNYNDPTKDGALDVDMPDDYPQGFNCSAPATWNGVHDLSGYHYPGKPLGIAEFQGGSFDPWGGPGFDACRTLTGPDFESVFYKNNIANGATQQNFYMTYGGTSWGWQADPGAVYTSYDYGSAVTESRQLTTKYNEDKLIGYFTQSVAPLTKTDRLVSSAPTSPNLVDLARINPDDHTQFHVLRHTDSRSTSTDSTQLTLDLGATGTTAFTYDDPSPALNYTGSWSHVGPEQSYTGGDYNKTESFSNTTGNSMSVTFTGTAIRWISSKESNHGIADVYLDGTDAAHKVATVDGYGSSKLNQQVFYTVSKLENKQHTLTIKVTGQKNPSSQDTYVVVDAIDLPAPGADQLVYTVPQKAGTAITFAGRDAKTIVANYQMGAQKLQYSTSEIMTQAQIGDRDVALLYGRSGQDGETVLHYAAKPTVQVLDGTVDSTWDADRGDLRLNYTHTGLARVLITGGSRPLLLLLATDEVAATFWRQDTAAGPVLVRGPYLVRTAAQAGSRLDLTGDTATASDLEVFSTASGVTWNGSAVATATTSSGSRAATSQLAGPKAVTLPALTTWKHTTESPESKPDFDDSTWTAATKTTSNSITPVPAGQPVLFADDYGYHYGDVWYRGHFAASGTETGINLSTITGKAGVSSVWLNGTLLGSLPSDGGSGQKDFTFPAGTLRKGADNVVSVLVENMGHNEDWTESDSQKEARGLTGFSLDNGGATTVAWRIQGAQGGENLADTLRGPMNNGGLFGERSGWYKPEFKDDAWSTVSLSQRDTTPGVSWYRTTVTLDLPKDQDTSVGLTINDDPSHHYRALIFVNGWQFGRYVNDKGPQHSFPIPNGVLNPNGSNTIAIAVWNTDASTGGLGTVSLTSYGSQRTAVSATGGGPGGGPTPSASDSGQPGGGSGGTGGPGGSASPSASGSGHGGTIGGLPVTGTQVALIAGVGAVLVGLGLLIVTLTRRRRAALAGGDDTVS